MAIVSPIRIISGGEHEGEVFDSPGYSSALKKSGYTREEAEKYWKENPVTPKLVPQVSITLDKNTGNIKVSAPKDIYESEAFKQVFKSSDLEALSRAYKTNPAVRVETSEGEMIGVEDMVKMLDADAKKFAKNVANEAAVKSLLTESFGENVGSISQNQIIRMGASGDLENQQETESLISIPKTVSAMFPRLFDLSSFADDSVKQGDFFENFYNLSKTSREDITRLRKTIDDYFENGDFSDLDEFSKMYALRDFIYTYEPEAGFWEQEGLKWGAAGEGAARGLAGFTAGGIALVQGASDLLVNAMEGTTWLLAQTFGEDYTMKKPSEVDWDLINTGIGAFFGTEDLNEELANQYEERTEYYYALNRSAATTMMISNLVTSVAANIVAGRAIGNLIGNFASAASVAKGYNTIAEATNTGKIVTETGQAYTGWNAVMRQITGSANPSLWQTLKVLSSADTTKVFAGARATISALAATPGAVSSAQLAKAISASAKILKTGRLISTGANFLAQVTLDTTLASPIAMRRIISGEATDEDKQIYLREIAWNAAGYGAGILLAKATSIFSKTKFGEAANAWASQKMASAKTTFHDMSDSIKRKIWGDDWLNNISNAGKRQVARYNEIIAEANRQIANATGDLSSTGAAATKTQAVKDAQARAIAVQNAIDNQEAGLKYYMNLYTGGNVKNSAETYYPALSDALRKTTENETKLSKVLNDLNITADSKPTALVNGVATNLDVPQDVVNYINDLYSREYLLRKRDLSVLTGDEEKGLEIAQKRIATFELNRPEELATFLKDEYLPSLYSAYRQINIHRAEAHIESSANRAGLIESGLFGKDGERWIHMQAVTNFQKSAVDNTNRLSSELSGFARVEDIPDYYHYSWGSEKDYVHPQLALQNYLWQTAVAENARNSWQDFSPIYKEKTELLVSGEKGEAAQTYQNLKKNLEKVAKMGLGSITEDLDVDGVVSSVVQDLKNIKTLEKAQAKARRAQEKAVDVATKDLKVTQKDKLAAVMSISDDVISEVFGDNSMDVIGLSKESWDSFVADVNAKIRNGIAELFKDKRHLTGYTEDPKELTVSAVEEVVVKAKKERETIERLKKLSWKDYRATFRFHPEINAEIDRLRIQNDKRYWDNDIIVRTATNQKRAKLMFEAGDAMNETVRQLNLPATNERMEAILAARRAIDGFKEYVLNDVAAKEVIDAIAFSVAPDNLEIARDYVVLKVLEKNKKGLEIALVKMFNKDKFSDAFKKMGPRSVEKNKKAVIKLVMDELSSELNDSRELLRAAGETIIDEEDVMAEIKNLVREIDDLSGEETVVAVYNNEGQLELYRTDPVLADLYNYRPLTPPSKAEVVFGNPVFRTMNRVARFFQTTLNPKSTKNQFFRDFGNAYFGTGSYEAMGMISRDLQVEYGGALADKLIEDLETTSPSTLEFLKKESERTGTSMEQLVVDRYLSFGRITSPAETPTSFYREPFDRGEGFAASLKKTKNKLAEFGNRLLEKAESVNQARETYLRNATYAKGLQDGLESGMTVRDAQRMAQFFQRNGTTNFGRQLYHFRALQKTVNYFGAGVNGFTSFWRLFSIDPVGVSTRIFSGLIVPTIFATATTLASEENREKYIHLPEYYKKEQFIFMMNGRIYRIPIPQELDAFVAPVRHAVENLYNSNRNSFGELLLSDFLNIGPIEFGAVMMLDRDRLVNEAPTFLDRAGALGLDLIDQTTPNGIKLPFQAVTGIDTYTGDKIDNSYYIIDDDNNRILVGGTTSKFALQVAKTTGASPSIISHVVDSLVGQVGEDILDVVFGGEDAMSLVENTVSGLTSFQTADYNLVRSEWNNTVAQLWDEKETKYLPAYVDYSNQINAATEPSKIEDLKKKRQDAIQPFLDKVKTAVGNLKSSYGGSYDQFRFASVVSLLTFDTGTTSGNTNEAKLAERTTFYDNRNNAYLWMSANGLNASTDRSLLGYLTRNKDGETVVKYNTPTGILAMRDSLYGAGDRDVATIQITLDGAGIKRSDMFGDDYNVAKAQGKTALKQYKAAWNAKVVRALAPYIQERGVSSVVNNATAQDLLGNYIFVDNPYQTKQYLTKIFGGS